MDAIIIVAIISGSLITLVGLLCATVLLILRMRSAGLSSAARKAGSEEAKMMQEMYRGLEEMERRIDALETILMDRESAGEKQQ